MLIDQIWQNSQEPSGQMTNGQLVVGTETEAKMVNKSGEGIEFLNHAIGQSKGYNTYLNPFTFSVYLNAMRYAHCVF